LTRQTVKEIAQNYVGSLRMIGALVNELRHFARATNFFVLAVTIREILWVHTPPRQGKERGKQGWGEWLAAIKVFRQHTLNLQTSGNWAI
jgi:hypothetical protein